MTATASTASDLDALLGDQLLADLAEYRRFLDDPERESAEPIDHVVHRIAGGLLGRRDSLAAAAAS